MLYIPRTTEKAYSASTQNTYIFIVPASASKQTIAAAISEAFKVKVVKVKTLIRKGKPTRFSRGRRAYPGTTHRQDQKYAYITLAAGDKIPVFETETSAAATEPAVKTEEKSAAKSDIKATKSVETVTNRRTGNRGDK